MNVISWTFDGLWHDFGSPLHETSVIKKTGSLSDHVTTGVIDIFHLPISPPLILLHFTIIFSKCHENRTATNSHMTIYKQCNYFSPRTWHVFVNPFMYSACRQKILLCHCYADTYMWFHPNRLSYHHKGIHNTQLSQSQNPRIWNCNIIHFHHFYLSWAIVITQKDISRHLS